MQGINVNKASGPGGISCRILHELASELAQILTALYIQSLASDKLPEDWLQAHVCPISRYSINCSKLNKKKRKCTSGKLETVEQAHLVYHRCWISHEIYGCAIKLLYCMVYEVGELYATKLAALHHRRHCKATPYYLPSQPPATLHSGQPLTPARGQSFYTCSQIQTAHNIAVPLSGMWGSHVGKTGMWSSKAKSRKEFFLRKKFGKYYNPY